MPDRRLDVLAIGNAIVDVIADAADAFLAAHGRLWKHGSFGDGLLLRARRAAGEEQGRGEDDFAAHGVTMAAASRGRKVAAD